MSSTITVKNQRKNIVSMAPSHLVTELVVLSEYLPWYEVNELRTVNKEWNVVISEALARNPCWQRIIDYLNENNCLRLCNYCGKPWYGDGTNTDLCYCTDDELSRSLKILPNPDARGCLGFMDIPIYQRAKVLFKYHAAVVRRIQRWYIQTFVQDADFDDWSMHLTAENGHAKFFLEHLYHHNRGAFVFIASLGTLLVAKSDLVSKPWRVHSKISSRCYRPGHFEEAWYALRDSDMPFEEDSLDIYFEETLNRQPCQCLEVLFGPKLIKRIDMFARLKEFLPLHRHNLFPGGWHTLGVWDDDDNSIISSGGNKKRRK